MYIRLIVKKMKHFSDSHFINRYKIWSVRAYVKKRNEESFASHGVQQQQPITLFLLVTN
jgi:hypothetical protein